MAQAKIRKWNKTREAITIPYKVRISRKPVKHQSALEVVAFFSQDPKKIRRFGPRI